MLVVGAVRWLAGWEEPATVRDVLGASERASWLRALR